jgi:hypothetical protein
VSVVVAEFVLVVRGDEKEREREGTLWIVGWS